MRNNLRGVGKRDSCLRAAAAIVSFGLLSSGAAIAQSAGVTGTAAQASEIVKCKVIYDDVNGDNHQYNDDWVSVRAGSIQGLPLEGPMPPGLNAGTLSLPDVAARFTKRIQTKDGPVLETYDGTFSKIVGTDSFVPFGERIVLKPEIWWPAADDGEPEIYTAMLPAMHLRALWLGKPHFGSNEPLSSYYFAVSVQLFSRKFHLKTALFSGTKVSQVDDGSVLGWFSHRKQAVALKDSPVADLSPEDDATWEHEIRPRCAAFRLSQ